jgi:tripartite-type tricarboxylate transporter receptor subunit TctC
MIAERVTLLAIITLASVFDAECPALAQKYPTRPITIVVPNPTGGGGDALARVIAPSMTKSLGQTVIIENVAGADGSVGAGRVARARPDGYTIGLGFLGTHVFNGAYYSLPYDVLNDFAPISPLVRIPALFSARKTFPPNNLMELIAWLKANPNKATVGRTAVPFHVLVAFLRKETGTQFAIIPYPPVCRTCWPARSICWSPCQRPFCHS